MTKKLTTLILILMILLVVVPVMAKENTDASLGSIPSTTSQPKGPTDRAEMEAFLDNWFSKVMEEDHIAGAAVSVVKNGELFFAKGYGYADLENRIPVDADQTVFHIGSVTKLFTWTAVMQLVEQGKLDLEADINSYLDFPLPNTYPQPITFKNLMAHTSGFEERWLGSAVSDVKDLLPVREWLISHMSAQVLPPGDYAGYSNYNAILAGYIVARVSGLPFEQYMQENILDPLYMAHTSVQSITPTRLAAQESLGYFYVDGAFQVFPDCLPQPALLPSGGVETTVIDMAHFMIAHMQNGIFREAGVADGSILKESTIQQMHTTLFTPDSRLLGTAYGFFDLSDNGQKALGSEGYFPPMHSQLLLIPDQNLGVFVTYNSDGGGELTIQHNGFQRAFFDHYYPASEVATIQPPADFAQRANQFVGRYKRSTSPQTTLHKVIRLFGGFTIEIINPGDGTLLFPLEGHDFRFVEVQPLYFRQVDGPFSIIFSEDDRGHITHMITDLVPEYAYIKLNWYESPGFNTFLGMVCVLIFLSVIPVALTLMIRDHRKRSDSKTTSLVARSAFWIILAIGVMNLLVVGVLAWGYMGGMPNELLDPPFIIKIILGLGVLSAVMTVAALIFCVASWKNSYWGIIARTYYTLVTVAAIAFVWFMNFWNLLGWRF